MNNGWLSCSLVGGQAGVPVGRVPVSQKLTQFKAASGYLKGLDRARAPAKGGAHGDMPLRRAILPPGAMPRPVPCG